MYPMLPGRMFLYFAVRHTVSDTFDTVVKSKNKLISKLLPEYTSVLSVSLVNTEYDFRTFHKIKRR